MAYEMNEQVLLLDETNVVVSGVLFDRYVCIKCTERCPTLEYAGNKRPKIICRKPEALASRL